MSRTGLTVTAAGLLVVLSLAAFLTRREMLGADINGPRGHSTWKVTLTVAGEMPANQTTLITLPPLDFRQQHIFDEHLASEELSHRATHGRLTGRREIVWKRLSNNGRQSFALTYSFRCSLGMWPPTPGMERLTEALDGPPGKGIGVKRAPMGKRTALKPARRIESEHREIQACALALVRDGQTQADQARALYEYVHGLAVKDVPASQSALACLRAQAGGSAGKARLLVALCRNRSIPARLISGLVLRGSREQGLHFWAEAWVNNYWLPLDPAEGHFGAQTFPRNRLVVHVGEEDVVRGRQSTFRYHFAVEKQHEAAADDEEAQLDEEGERPGAFWKRLSLYTLEPAEQQLVRFLLLLPLAALIVSLYRTVIGVPTFGTFAPALMGMAFLDLKVMPWGMSAFFLIVLLGWGLRHVLDRFHLLMVPRVSALLTVIVMVLVTAIVVAAHLGVPTTSYMALFPLVILTHLVERFWTLEAEDGTAASFRTLMGTFLVAVTVSLALSPAAVGTWMFRYPETVGVVLACQLLLGRYTGYRLTELYRFQDLITENPHGGGGHGLAGALAEAPRAGHPGHEPAQRGVHPGPEPAGAVPAGGRQAPDARLVPADRGADA